MALYEDLAFARREAARCMACGNCQEVCPIYYETKREGSVARGKIKLVEAILDGVIDTSTPGLEHNLSLCLTCKACNNVCPSGVEIDKIILSARAAVVRDKGLHPLKKVIFDVVNRPRLMDTGMRLGGRFQGLAFKKEVESGGTTPRFPFGLDMRRVMPNLATVPFRTGVAEYTPSRGEEKYRVAFFTGCSANYLYANIPQALMQVLEADGHVSVIVPKKQHCCGTPILTHGDAKTAKEMAISHVNTFADLDVDYILTVCGSCALSFTAHYLELLEDDPKMYAKAQKVAAKIMDWSDFVVNILKPDLSNLHTEHHIVTYHDPCHLNRGLSVTESPREILRQLPDIDFVEMSNANRCCGSAGSFSLTHYDLSMDIQKKKWDGILATGADMVATGCGSCIMQLTDGQHMFGGNHPVKHTVEILADAMKRSK